MVQLIISKIRAFSPVEGCFAILCDLMSRKAKRVAGETSLPPYGGGVYEDAKTRLKHQALLQDYQDLQKETDDLRNKLDAAKQRKLRLMAEVQFLRRRHKYLLKMKLSNRSREPPLNIEKQHNLNGKGRISQKRETALFKLPPLPKPKPKGKMHSGKEAATRNITPILDLNRRQTLDSGKEATLCSSTPVSELNLRKRIASGTEAAVPNSEAVINLNKIQKMQVANDTTAFASRRQLFDLNQDTSLINSASLCDKEATLCSRAPTFDLNEISTEEEEPQNNYEPSNEETKVGLMRGGNEEQSNDLKLSVCRNVGEGSSRIGKRKISWQDPVALRV